MQGKIDGSEGDAEVALLHVSMDMSDGQSGGALVDPTNG